jgi:hypothetical protein
MIGLLVWLGFVVFCIVLYYVCNCTPKAKASKAAAEEIRRAKEEEKSKAKWMKNYGERAKGRRVGLVYKKEGQEECKQEFADIFAASEALGFPAENIWAKANLGITYNKESKDSFEIVKYRFYWIHNQKGA